MQRPVRGLVYLAGCLIFAAGAYLYIHAKLGTDPLDVLALGLMLHLPLTVGIVQTSVAVLCLALTAWIRGSWPPLSPILTFFLCGSLIDVMMYASLGKHLPLPPFAVMLAGTVCCA